ncbi:hypothetical protein [Pedobacter aquatilis]|nr:hypothetical protein [Pedobacter aquatilis]
MQKPIKKTSKINDFEVFENQKFAKLDFLKVQQKHLEQEDF